MIVFFLSLMCFCCISCTCRKPQGFSLLYAAAYTGLDTLVNIEGYYKVQYDTCIDDNSHIYLMFYPDGLLNAVAYSTSDETKLINCFKNGGKDCVFIQWGTYRISNDTIKIQEISNMGLMVQGNITFYEFKILPTKELLYIAKHCINKALPVCNQNPINSCPKVAEFYPLDKKRNITDCPHLKKGWFNIKK